MKKQNFLIYCCLCTFLILQSTTNTIGIGNYKRLVDSRVLPSQNQPNANVAAVAGLVTVVAETYVAVAAAGYLLGRLAYNFFEDGTAMEDNIPLTVYNPSDFSEFDPKN